MSRFNQRPIAAAVVLMFSGTGPALAQQTAPQPQPAQTMPEVKVTAPPEGQGFKTDATRSAFGTETPLRDIPQFINTVPEPVIRQQAATSLSEALRNVPGITMTAPEGGVTASQIFWLRGFPVAGDTFLDGVRDLGEYNRDLFNIQQVEVLKGASALLFGRGSTAGVINQVSKVPDLLPRTEVGLSLGTNGEARLVGDANFLLAPGNALRLNLLGEYSDTYRDTIQNHQFGFAPTMRFGIGSPTEVTIAYEYLWTNTKTDYGQPTLGPAFGWQMPPVNAKKYYGLPNYDEMTYNTNIATVTIDHRFSDAFSLRNTTRWANYRREGEATQGVLAGTDLTGAPVTAATPFSLLQVTRTHNKARDNDDDVLINQTDFTWKVATGAIKHTVTGGLVLSTERLNRTTYAFDADPATAKIDPPTSNTPLLAPDYTSLISYTKTPQNLVKSQGDTVAVYALDQMQLTREWSLVGGLRWEWYEAKTQQTALSTLGTTTGPFEQSEGLWSGRLGAIWQPTERQSYYVSWGNSYNPSGELGVYGASGTNLNAQTQFLDPEETDNYEIGGHWDITPALRLRSAIFRTQKSNARFTDPADGIVKLAGERRVDGWEAELTGSLTANWDIYSGVAYMDGKVVQAEPALTGKKMAVAPWTGNVWTVYRLGEGWQIGGGMFASSSRYIDEQNRGKIPGWARFDAMIGYVQKRYDIQLNVFNIFDKVYYVGGYQNNPVRVLPGQSLTGMLTLRYRFL
jgi:catecholate siderophore receptor